jgi:hypothetical protein
MSALAAELEAPETERSTGRPKKPPTDQVRIASDLVAQAWRVATMKGYRAAGDFLSDLLRPILNEMERELLSERAKQMGRPKRRTRVSGDE